MLLVVPRLLLLVCMVGILGRMILLIIMLGLRLHLGLGELDWELRFGWIMG